MRLIFSALSLLSVAGLALAGDPLATWCGESALDGVCVRAIEDPVGTITYTAFNNGTVPARITSSLLLSPINGTLPLLTLMTRPTTTRLVGERAPSPAQTLWRLRVLVPPQTSGAIFLQLYYNTATRNITEIQSALNVTYEAVRPKSGTACKFDDKGIGAVCALFVPNAWSTRVTIYSTVQAYTAVQVLFYDYAGSIITRFHNNTSPLVSDGCRSPTNVPYCVQENSFCCLKTLILRGNNITYDVVASEAPLDDESFQLSTSWLVGWAGVSRFYYDFLLAEMPANSTALASISASIDHRNAVRFPLAAGTPINAVLTQRVLWTGNSSLTLDESGRQVTFQVLDGTTLTYDPLCNITASYGGDWIFPNMTVGSVCPDAALQITLYEHTPDWDEFWLDSAGSLPYSTSAVLPFYALNCTYGASWAVNTSLSGLPDSLRTHCLLNPLVPPPTPTPEAVLIDLGKDGALFAGLLVAGTIVIMLAIILCINRYRKRLKRLDHQPEISDSISLVLSDARMNMSLQQSSMSTAGVSQSGSNEQQPDSKSKILPTPNGSPNLSTRPSSLSVGGASSGSSTSPNVSGSPSSPRSPRSAAASSPTSAAS